MKSKEDILEQMRIEMPFNFPERIKPYVMEAMDIYAIQMCKETQRLCAKNATTEHGYFYDGSKSPIRVVDKCSIISENNIPKELL